MVSIVVVNHNAWDDVARLWAELSSNQEVRDGLCEVIVVDNASAGPVPDELSQQATGLKLVRRGDNGGFAVGVNAGWDVANGRWLLVLNPDVVVAKDFVRDLLARIVHHESRGSAAPGIIGFALANADGSAQPSVGENVTVRRLLWEALLPRRHRKYRSIARHCAGSVDWVTGACMLVQTSLRSVMGGMDDDFFLYYEEVAFCETARAHGFGVEFDPALCVTHLRPLQSRNVTPALRVVTRHSRLQYFRKYKSKWQFRVIAAATLVEALARELGARAFGSLAHATAWSMIGWMAKDFMRGMNPKGAEVRDLVELRLGWNDVDRGDRPHELRAPHGARLRASVGATVAGRRR